MATVAELLDDALATGDDRDLRAALLGTSERPGARTDLRIVDALAAAVGQLVQQPDAPVEALEALLDGWAATGPAEAPGDSPEVILPCAAIAAYGEVGAVRPDWWQDEMVKLRRAAADERTPVREAVARARQRMLDADPHRDAPGRE